jgi:hypothetical protein
MMLAAGVLVGVLVIALGAFYLFRREKRKPDGNPYDVYPHW